MRQNLENHLDLAHAVAKKFVRPEERINVRDTEEYSLAVYKLFQASLSHNPEGGASFGSYAWLCMERALIDQKRKTSRFSLCELVDVEEREEQDYSELSELVNLLLSADDTDSKSERLGKEICRAIYFENRSVQDIADEMGVSKVTIHSRRRSALNKMRTKLESLSRKDV